MHNLWWTRGICTMLCWFMSDQMGRIWEETLVAYTACYSTIFLEGLRRKTSTNTAHIPSKIRLKHLFQYFYRVVKSGELEGYGSFNISIEWWSSVNWKAIALSIYLQSGEVRWTGGLWLFQYIYRVVKSGELEGYRSFNISTEWWSPVNWKVINSLPAAGIVQSIYERI